uniref:mTERF transcription factor n=1 Tax=Zea mays TaxID=4577 RepID=A0A804MS14_MAIZE
MSMLLIQKQPLPLSVRPRTTLRQCRLPTTRFSAAAADSASRAAPFAVEDYLVAACHLTPAQALKASKVLSHLKSPSRPDAVLAFLSGLGLSDADIAAAVAYDPKLLCSEVERTLAPRLAELRDLGLSPSQIARLALVDPARFRRPTVVSKLQYYVPLFGSFENLLQALRNNAYLLSSDLERVVKPNVAFLVECGLDACDIAKLSIPVPRLITTNPERVRAMVERAEAVGVPRGTGMFRHALLAVAFLSEEKIKAKAEFLKTTFRWSDAEVGVAVSKLPLVLKHSKDRLRRMSEFLITKENGLLEQDRSYYTAVQMSESAFMDKFICPYKEAAPSLALDYAAACRGEVDASYDHSHLLGFYSPFLPCRGKLEAILNQRRFRNKTVWEINPLWTSQKHLLSESWPNLLPTTRLFR